MCGLAGIFHRTASGDIDTALLRRMTAALRHRGPDGDGFHVESGIGLGHRRLAIIDVAGGDQPMYNEDDSVVIVFNGEIYNFHELRPKLQALGHVFRNRCDTEAIIHAWESWGPDCLQHLSGMFAFALWDRNRQTLFLARDRLGKKPMHYAVAPDGTFTFASEIGAFASVPNIARGIDATAVDDFFAFGYIQEPASIYEGIRKLPAAHYLLLRRGDTGVEPKRYWAAPTGTTPIDETQSRADLLDRLTECVRKRLISDVPLGAFLSGGVDSSAVVAVAAGLNDGPLATFTVAFEGADDESRYAEEIARRYSTAQHSDTSRIDYMEAARRQGAMFGEPIGDQSSVPSYQVAVAARRHVTVALSGDGGDEVFAGYRRYQWHQLTEAVRSYIPRTLRRSVLAQAARLYPKLDLAPRWMRAKYTLTELSLDSALGYVRMLTKTHHDRRRALFSPSLEAALDGYDPSARIARLMEESGAEDPLLQAQWVDVNTYLVGDILTKVDRVSMATSLEVRAPFLDHEMVEWGLRLPANLKLRGGQGKYVLKRALEKLLPTEILYRPKQGFATSLAGLFRRETHRLRDRLLGPAMLDSGLFSADSIGQLVDEHVGGRFDHSNVLWLLLVFEGFLASTTGSLAVERDAHAYAAPLEQA